MKLQYIERSFPHDDIAVYLPGTTAPINAKVADMRVESDTVYADGTQGVVCKLKDYKGHLPITMIGVVNGVQKVVSDYDAGKIINE